MGAKIRAHPLYFYDGFSIIFSRNGPHSSSYEFDSKNALHLTSQLMVVVFIFYSRKSGSNGIDGKKRSD